MGRGDTQRASSALGKGGYRGSTGGFSSAGKGGYGGSSGDKGGYGNSHDSYSQGQMYEDPYQSSVQPESDSPTFNQPDVSQSSMQPDVSQSSYSSPYRSPQRSYQSYNPQQQLHGSSYVSPYRSSLRSYEPDYGSRYSNRFNLHSDPDWSVPYQYNRPGAWSRLDALSVGLDPYYRNYSLSMENAPLYSSPAGYQAPNQSVPGDPPQQNPPQQNPPQQNPPQQNPEPDYSAPPAVWEAPVNPHSRGLPHAQWNIDNAHLLTAPWDPSVPIDQWEAPVNPHPYGRLHAQWNAENAHLLTSPWDLSVPWEAPVNPYPSSGRAGRAQHANWNRENAHLLTPPWGTAERVEWEQQFGTNYDAARQARIRWLVSQQESSPVSPPVAPPDEPSVAPPVAPPVVGDSPTFNQPDASESPPVAPPVAPPVRRGRRGRRGSPGPGVRRRDASGLSVDDRSDEEKESWSHYSSLDPSPGLATGGLVRSLYPVRGYAVGGIVKAYSEKMDRDSANDDRMIDVYDNVRSILESGVDISDPRVSSIVDAFIEIFGEEVLFSLVEDSKEVVADSDSPEMDAEVTGVPAEGMAYGGMVSGPGTGTSDSIPAVIDGQEQVMLSNGEYVIPADAVNSLGNGSSDSGAMKLMSMVDNIRSASGGRAA